MFLTAATLFSRAKAENSCIEDKLHTYLDRMASAHQELEDLRYSQIEDRNEELADQFRCHSKAVLRVAYSRFLRSVRKRIRGSRIAIALLSVYNRYLRKTSWAAWLAFVHRRRFMHTSRRRRAGELALGCLTRWKVFAALERHFNNSRRGKLLRATFRAWRDTASFIKWDRWSIRACDSFEARRTKRRFFAMWKQDCVLLQWNSRRTALLESTAVRHFTSVVIAAWRDVSRAGRQSMQGTSYLVSYGLKLGLHFALWKNVCELRWKRRGKLVRRFFSNSKMIVLRHKSCREHLTQAFSAWTGTRVHRCFGLWMRVVRQRQRFRHGSSRQTVLAKYRQRIALQETLLTLAHSSALRRRLLMCRQAASRHYVWRIARGGLRDLHFVTAKERRHRYMAAESILRGVLDFWRTRLPVLRRDREVVILEERQRRRAAYLATRRAFAAIKRSVSIKLRLQRLREAFESANLYKIQRKHFCRWKGSFGRLLFWRARELRVDVSHAKALNDLKTRELTDLEAERSGLRRISAELQSVLTRQQRELALKDEDIYEKEKLIASRNDEKLELENNLQEVRGNLVEKQRERDRLRIIEAEFIESVERDRERTQRAQEAHVQSINRLQEERNRLAAELAKAHEEARVAKEGAERKLAEEILQLENQEAVNATLTDAISKKEIEVEQLTREKNTIRREVDTVQQRLRELTAAGCSLLEEGESSLRKRESSVRNLKLNTGQAEARVIALRGLVGEKKRELTDLRLQTPDYLQHRHLQTGGEKLKHASVNRSTGIGSDHSLDEFLAVNTPKPSYFNSSPFPSSFNSQSHHNIDMSSVPYNDSTFAVQTDNGMRSGDDDASSDDDARLDAARMVARFNVKQLAHKFDSSGMGLGGRAREQLR